MGYYAVILFIIYSPWFTPCNANSTHKKFSSDMLELKVQLPDIPVYLNHPLPVKVTLFNKGDAPVLVNTRMSVGYPKSVSRELYADLKNLDTGNPAGFDPLDINRDFATAADYKLLNPLDSIFTTFDLLKYYPLKKSGNYELILHYQANEKMAKSPSGIWKDIVSSKPEQLKILPGKIPSVN